jgi:hypothetical protein
MSIEITEFADVSISVAPTGVAGGNFGILGFLTNDTDDAKAGKEISVGERGRAYTSLASVSGDWETSSEVHKAATAFYSQTPTPRDFVAIVNYQTAQVGVLVGGGSDTAEELVGGASSGTWIGGEELVSLTINNTPVSFDATALSSASPVNYTTIAAELTTVLDAELSGAVVEHNGYQFVIKDAEANAGAPDSPNYITAAANTLASTALGLKEGVARAIDGIDAESATQSLAEAENQGVEFVGLVSHQEFRDNGTEGEGNQTLDIAKYAEASKKIFCNTTNDLTTLAPNSNSCIASVLKSNTLRFTLTTFSRVVDSYPSASVFGRAASVNFSAINSTITLNLKQMPGVYSEDLTPSEYANLKSYYASAVIQIGKSVNAYTDSRMANGSWLDTTHGLLWLENRCEVDLFNLLYVNNTKIPYTQAGINTVISTLDRSLQAAVRNGLAGPGYLPDGTFLPEGYVINAVSLGDTPTSDKSNRIYQGISFQMVGAGALHEVVVSGEYSE